MTALLERFAVEEAPGKAPAWLVRFDGAPLLHLAENHVAINDLRARNQFHWGFALVRNPWTEPPALRESDGGVHLFGGKDRVGTMRWHEDRPAHVEVVVFDLDHRLIDTEVRHRQLPATGVLHVPAAPNIGR